MSDITAAAAAAGVRVFLHARDLENDREVAVDADEPVVLASVFKIPVALELARRFSTGDIDPDERVDIPAGARTGGPTGLSVMTGPVSMTWRDLGRSMITVSDNAATDIVQARAGTDRVNALCRSLGLTNTWIEGDCAFLLGRLVADVGLAPDERDRLAADEPGLLGSIPAQRWRACRDLIPATTNRSTARDMTSLLAMIWADRAGPADACAYVRTVMGQQVWPHRLTAGFVDDVRCSGKTGTLPLIRNEAGVVEYPDGGRYAVAVFTVAEDAAFHAPDRDRVIGTVARLAVDELRS